MLGLGNSIVGGAALEETFSLSLDGNSDFASGNVSTLNSLTDFSISFWFHFTASIPGAGSEPILVMGGTAGGNRFYLQLLNSTTLRAPTNGYNSSTDDIVIDGDDDHGISEFVQDTWYHVTRTQDSGAVKLYLNAVEIGSWTTNAPGNAIGTSFHIGAYALNNGGNESFFFQGYMDDVATWDVALSAASVLAAYNNATPFDLTNDRGNYTNASDLAAYWRMEDGAGSTITDSSGNGKDLTLAGTAGFSTVVP